jgi:hypothetical protein
MNFCGRVDAVSIKWKRSTSTHLNVLPPPLEFYVPQFLPPAALKSFENVSHLENRVWTATRCTEKWNAKYGGRLSWDNICGAGHLHVRLVKRRL